MLGRKGWYYILAAANIDQWIDTRINCQLSLKLCIGTDQVEKHRSKQLEIPDSAFEPISVHELMIVSKVSRSWNSRDTTNVRMAEPLSRKSSR